MRRTAIISVLTILCFFSGGILPEAGAQTKGKVPRLSVYSNLAYDLALVPNVGIQVGLGSGWALSARWDGIWWSKPGNYWRLYGPELTVRRYFPGKKHPGHHAGLYGQLLTYDFELRGGKGYLGGEPGGNFFDGANWGAGVEYGYTFGLSRRLHLDLSLGLGYFGGKYYTYQPMGGQYIWLTTERRRYWGPTRLEVSLYWNLIL